jgi:hypothetical protein
MTNEGDALEQISLAAAMANSYARDQNGFLTFVALMLEGSIPEAIDVERKPVRLFSSEKHVVGIKINLGDLVFLLDESGRGHAPVAQKMKIVRGITLKTEQVPIDVWLADLNVAVNAYARQNQHASLAITEYLRASGLQ